VVLVKGTELHYLLHHESRLLQLRHLRLEDVAGFLITSMLLALTIRSSRPPSSGCFGSWPLLSRSGRAGDVAVDDVDPAEEPNFSTERASAMNGMTFFLCFATFWTNSLPTLMEDSTPMSRPFCPTMSETWDGVVRSTFPGRGPCPPP